MPLSFVLITLTIQLFVLNFASGVNTLYRMVIMHKESNTIVPQDAMSCCHSFLFCSLVYDRVSCSTG